MTTDQLEQLRYPIGKFNLPAEITTAHIERWTKVLEELPGRIENLVKNLSEEQLETPYRPDGWTVRQVVHHVADSHHHSYTRFKWTLTEDKPVIKAYVQASWAELADAKSAPIQISLDYLKALHAKLVYHINTLTGEDLQRTYIHPEGNKVVSLKQQIGTYAWHSQHHYAHIENLLKRKGWQ